MELWPVFLCLSCLWCVLPPLGRQYAAKGRPGAVSCRCFILVLRAVLSADSFAGLPGYSFLIQRFPVLVFSSASIYGSILARQYPVGNLRVCCDRGVYSFSVCARADYLGIQTGECRFYKRIFRFSVDNRNIMTALIVTTLFFFSILAAL